ncbi:hypothetical protein MSAN_01981200 [Mycena sanguinolenta]|uniref:Uncharacterized protein n=1 Tax=Mycena sanguinolenta TaxID=230812 RepID=A0A8H6XM72_9AGAR|nr:hypothetical protein MSAN_01981200 [Mycena sanguinolenta]
MALPLLTSSLHCTFMKRISNGIKSFRLGYAEERPYPWRWTTPIVLCAFLLISPFLAVVNVPLSAYNIVQEFTYQPNDTLPTVFLGNLVPSVLQNPTDSFTPQLLSVGETIVLDDNIFNYTISQAFDGFDTTKPVSTFPYYNNPLSDGCDVANITIQVQLTEDPVNNGWDSKVQASVEIDFTIHPCRDCDAVLAGAPLERGASLLKSPCSSNPPDFVVVEVQPVTFHFESDESWLLPPTSLPMQIADLLAQSSLGNISLSTLNIAYENLFQTFYHLIRLDLGVIVDNQIYNSPEMFNRTITPLDTGDSWANKLRNLTSNVALMVKWLEEVEFFQNNTRVPPLEYFRSVPRLKPLGSAVTSVFVSTFAMLSVLWTVFSLVAGGLARKHDGEAPNDALGMKATHEQFRTWHKRLESGVKGTGYISFQSGVGLTCVSETDEREIIIPGHPQEPDSVDRLRRRMDREGVQTRVALAAIITALKKHGLIENEDWVQDNDLTTVLR